MDSSGAESSSGASSDSVHSSTRRRNNTRLNPRNIVWSNQQLYYTGQECRTLPEDLDYYGKSCRRLDLSFNALSSLRGLDAFVNLEELILDNNQLTDTIRFPYLPSLRTLSVNKNKIKDLEGLLDKIVAFLPGLRYLSLLGNPACPNQLSSIESDDEDYHRYRIRVIYRLHKLKFLDSTPVRQYEKMEAIRVGPFTKVIRPTSIISDESLSDSDDDHRYTPLPQTLAQDGIHKGAYGMCRYKYLGLHSEGNRFIRNNDL